MRVLLDGFAAPARHTGYGEGFHLLRWCGIAAVSLLNGSVWALFMLAGSYVLGPVHHSFLAIWAGTAALSAVGLFVLSRRR